MFSPARCPALARAVAPSGGCSPGRSRCAYGGDRREVMDDDRGCRTVGRVIAIISLVFLAGVFFAFAPIAGAEVFGGSSGFALLVASIGVGILGAAILLVEGFPRANFAFR